jgi:hypothetical protein
MYRELDLHFTAEQAALKHAVHQFGQGTPPDRRRDRSQRHGPVVRRDRPVYGFGGGDAEGVRHERLQ